MEDIRNAYHGLCELFWQRTLFILYVLLIPIASSCQVNVEEPKSSPTISIDQIQSITSSSAEVRASITSNGGAAITRLGVVWDTRTGPTLSNSFLTASLGQAGFTLSITNLEVATLYYVRAFAENSAGIAYSEVQQFRTLAEIPVVVTGELMEATMNSIHIRGEVSDERGAQVTERGFVLSRVSNPSISDTKIIAGNGPGVMEAIFNELQVNTQYHIRAYAINEIGIAYGNNVIIRTADTLPISPPPLPPPGN